MKSLIFATVALLASVTQAFPGGYGEQAACKDSPFEEGKCYNLIHADKNLLFSYCNGWYVKGAELDQSPVLKETAPSQAWYNIWKPCLKDDKITLKVGDVGSLKTNSDYPNNVFVDTTTDGDQWTAKLEDSTQCLYSFKSFDNKYLCHGTGQKDQLVNDPRSSFWEPEILKAEVCPTCLFKVEEVKCA